VTAVVVLVLPAVAIYMLISTVVTRRAIRAWAEARDVELVHVRRVLMFGRRGLVDYDVTWRAGDEEHSGRLVARAFGGDAWLDERRSRDDTDAD
jgi:hypothetical protein